MFRQCTSHLRRSRPHAAAWLSFEQAFASQPATTTSKQLPELPPFHYKPNPYKGPSKEEVIAMRREFLSPGEATAGKPSVVTSIINMHPNNPSVDVCPDAAMFWHFKTPVMITEGKMQYLYDEKGKRYLDVSSMW